MATELDESEQELLQALLILHRRQRDVHTGDGTHAFLTMAQYAIQSVMAPGGKAARQLEAGGHWFVG